MKAPLPMPFKCLYPFVNLAVDSGGLWRPCCRFRGGVVRGEASNLEELNTIFKAPSFELLRKDIEAGHWNLGCEKCYLEEETGRKSMGRVFSDEYGDQLSQDEQPPSSLEIFLGANCNMKCRMCSSDFSTQWQKEMSLPISQFPSSETAKSREALVNNVDVLKKVKLFKIVGGEPFLNPLFFELLRNLNHQNLIEEKTLHISTNGSVFPDKELLMVLRKLKRLVIFVSVDGVGPVAEYIRTGVNWNTVSKNLNAWSALKNDFTNLSVSINMTLQAYNFNSLLEVYELAENLDVNFKFHELKHPSFLRYESLPLSFRREYIANNNKKFLEATIFDTDGFLKSENDQFKQLRQYTDDLDKKRNQSQPEPVREIFLGTN